MVIDARGLGCPEPMVLAQEALDKMDEGTVQVLVDNEAAVGNLEFLAQRNSYPITSEQEGGHWKVSISKGAAGEPMEARGGPPQEDRGVLLVVGTDTMGKDEDLGRVLMKAFFETMKATGETPHTIFFLNTGVRLTTTDEELVPVLRGIEELGVEIYSCGTCLKHYGLEDGIKVGFRGSSSMVVAGIRDFAKTVWI